MFVTAIPGPPQPAPPPPSTPSVWLTKRALTLLLLAAVALPLLLCAALSWLSWRQAWREAEMEMTRAADGAAEYAGRVLDGQRMAVDRLNDRLRGLSDDDIRAHEAELHLALRALVADTPQIQTAYVLDRHGRFLVSASVTPVPRDLDLSDSDHYRLLSAAEAPPVVVTRVLRGRLRDRLYFTVARRRRDTGNLDLPADGFAGTAAVSVDPEEMGAGLRRLQGQPDDTVALLRADGEILARSPGYGSTPALRLQPHSPILPGMAQGLERGLAAGPSGIDGIWRISAWRRVEGWPLYVAAGRPRSAVAAGWRRTAAAQLALGLPASLALLGLALLVRRGQRRLAAANAGLEQRVAERTAALTKSEARLRRVQLVGRVGGFEIDLRSGTNLRSAEYMRVHGRPPAATTEGHADWLARLHPADRDRAENHFLAAVADGMHDHDYAQEYRIVTPQGESRWVAARAEIERDAAGVALRMVGAHLDITDLKAAQAALAEGEARLRAALRGAQFGVWERHLPTSSGTWDARAAEIYGGLTPEQDTPDLAGWRGRVWPEDRAGRLAAIETAVAAGGPDNYDAEFRFRRGDGGWNWVAVHGAVMERDPVTGRAIRLAGVVQDVTGRREAEAALRESEARLRLAVEAARFSTWGFDVRRGTASRQGELVRAIPELPTEGFGLADWLRLIHDEDRAMVEDAFNAMVQSRSDRMAAEFRVRRPDGSYAWIASAGAVVERQPGTGQVLRVAGVAHDITDRKAAEQRMTLLAREVDHRAKNALSLVQAAIRLAPKNDAAGFARAVEGRVAALARAQILLSETGWAGAELRAIAEGALEAFLPAAAEAEVADDAEAVPQARLIGPAMWLAAAATQPISLAVHELATNAAKYGALSLPGGRVELVWAPDQAAGLLRLRWEERGGPPVTDPPTRRGFGGRVLEGTICGQLGGSVLHHWQIEGLVCEMTLPLARIT